MNRSKIETDHLNPICFSKVSDGEELKEAFNWKNTQPLLKQVPHQEIRKTSLLGCRLQHIRDYQKTIISGKG